MWRNCGLEERIFQKKNPMDKIRVQLLLQMFRSVSAGSNFRFPDLDGQSREQGSGCFMSNQIWEFTLSGTFSLNLRPIPVGQVRISTSNCTDLWRSRLHTQQSEDTHFIWASCCCIQHSRWQGLQKEAQLGTAAQLTRKGSGKFRGRKKLQEHERASPLQRTACVGTGRKRKVLDTCHLS